MKDKKELIKFLISNLLVGLVWTFLVYLCLTKYNDMIVEILQVVKEENSALLVCRFLYPIIFIVSCMIYTGRYVISSRQDVSVKKNIKKKK